MLGIRLVMAARFDLGKLMILQIFFIVVVTYS